jgi:hypothetical protein
MERKNTSPTDAVHQGDPDTHITRWTDRETPVASVVEAVAAVTNTPPTSLSPLYDAVDPDALNRLVEPGRETSSSDRRVSFRFEGCLVTVHGDGRTVVSLATDRGP